MAQRIHVDQLKVGMYVEKLDRPWVGTPFPLQGVQIASIDDVRKLKDFCHYVYIYDGTLSSGGGKPQVSGANKRSLAKQFREAKEVRKEALSVVKSLQRSARAGKTIDADGTQSFIEELIPQLARNANALICLSNLTQKDEYTANHSINVCVLTMIFGQALGLTDDELRTLGVGAILHDIGKMSVPSSILNKPGRLTDNEFDVIRTHPVEGERIASAANAFDDSIIAIVRNHHERFGGGGYPDGRVMQSSLDLYAQLVSLVDVYDALTSNRTYRDGLPTPKALSIMERSVNDQFNPELFVEFKRYFLSQQSGSIVQLNTGEIGIRLPSDGDVPVVLLIMDQHKNRFYPLRIVDFKLLGGGDAGKRIQSELPASGYGINIGEFIDQAFSS